MNNERRRQTLTRIAGCSPTNWTLYAIMQLHCCVRIRWPAEPKTTQERVRQMALHEIEVGPKSSFSRQNSLREFDHARYPDWIAHRAIFLQPNFSDNFISDIGYREYYAVLTEYLLATRVIFLNATLVYLPKCKRYVKLIRPFHLRLRDVS